MSTPPAPQVSRVCWDLPSAPGGQDGAVRRACSCVSERGCGPGQTAVCFTELNGPKKLESIILMSPENRKLPPVNSLYPSY